MCQGEEPLEPQATLHTSRLFAERPRAEHLADICVMHQDPQVMATLGGIRSIETTRQLFERWMQHWEQYGYGVYVWRTRTDGCFVGRAGLLHVHVGGNCEVELLYALQTVFWGKGLATELAHTLVHLGFEHIGLKDMVCFTLPTNHASQRVMQKVGFRYERDIVHADLPHVFCRLTASAYRGQ